MPSADLRFDANLGWLFTEVPFLERFDLAAAAGFDGVEYPSPYDHTVGELRTSLQNAGLTQVLINTPQGPPGDPTRGGIACFPEKVSEFRDGVDRGLEYAVGLGSEFLHVCAGLRQPETSRDRAFARYVSNIVWAAERAKGSGVTLVLEVQNKWDSPDFILDSQQQTADVIDAVGQADVGLMFDVYHARRMEGGVAATLASVRDHVVHVQIADSPDRHEPGSGDIEWRAVFDALRDSGYSGWIGCEYRPSVDSMSSLEWMKELRA